MKENEGFSKYIKSIVLNFIPAFLIFLVEQVRREDILNIPAYIYTTALAILVFWLLLNIFFLYVKFKRKTIKDRQYVINGRAIFRRNSRGISVNYNNYEYEGLYWELKLSVVTNYGGTPTGEIEVYNVVGPLCYREDCLTSLNQTLRFFGGYKYTCPSCDFTKKLNKNAMTLKRDVFKTYEAELKRGEYGLDDFSPR